ncbi:MAG: glycosyltransferase family protein [Candidatus Kapabacteria bacterium]|jgi:spore coat polysaccharide biosynthesis protein SpsF|nr:glycosyltransferase family protein [Candidatus Kapabacteria bacterium]
MPNIVAIVQARMSSTRLPGKVLKPLGSKIAVARVVHQLSGSKRINHIVLATSIDASDDPLVSWARRTRTEYMRGSLHDVLDRYYRTATHFKADIVVRITADCPLIDPVIVDSVIERLLEGDCDYAANVNPPTFPDGYDSEVMTFEALERTWTNAHEQPEREHVTLHIRNHPELFRVANVAHTDDISKLRLTLDTQEDYDFLNRVIQKLEMKHISEANPRFLLRDVLEMLNKDRFLFADAPSNDGYSPKESYYSLLQSQYMPRL